MNKPIILLISAKAQHGKDSFADAFIKEAQGVCGYRCLRIKYGDILKYVCKEYFGWNGEKDEVGRQMLQQVGTNLCRSNNPNIWLNCVKEIVKGLQTEYDFVLIPDCRFPNELDWQDTDFFTFTISPFLFPLNSISSSAEYFLKDITTSRVILIYLLYSS